MPPDSASRFTTGVDHWGPTEHLLAAAVDALRAANWQRGGGKGMRPKPLPRPMDRNQNQWGDQAMPIEEMRELQKAWREGRLAEWQSS